MKTQKRRGFLAKAGAILAVAALALSASPSYAQDTIDVMPEKSDVVITKLQQPDAAGEAATGAVNPDAGRDVVPGVTFEAYEVPVAGDEGTNEWQRAIAGMDLATAKGLVNRDDPAESGQTGAGGTVSWTGVDRGLYLIRETATPAGVIPAEDFLLAVPMTNPAGNGWLDEIFIYPKGSTFTAGKTVENASDYEVGDAVTWTINADIPTIRSHSKGDLLAPDRFEIVDTFEADELKLVDGAASVNAVLSEGLIKGVEEDPRDYYVLIDEEAGTTTVKIIFTEDGRDKLLAALESGTEEVTVTLDTRVLKVGVLTTNATVYSSQDERAEGLSLASQTVKYGNIMLKKIDTNEDPAAGAVFRVYANEESAKAKDENFLRPAENLDGEWTTGDNGEVVLGGFRYSNFADGKETAEDHRYWLVEMEAPEGQQLLAEPIAFTIDSVDDDREIITVQNTANANAFVLPLTGGTGTALLTMLGLGILAIVVFVARARRNADA